MTYRGTVKNGVVVFDGPERPPEGAVVAFEFSETPFRDTATDEAKARRLSEALLKLAGTMKQELPTDASQNVDHYLYGHPKR